MPLGLSQRSECVEQSEIRNMSIECRRLGGINLSQGVCDVGVPEPVRRGAQAAVDEGINTYTRYDGLPTLRRELARKLGRAGIEADPEGEVVVTAGSTGAFLCACWALLDPGDEVILFEPYYGYHRSTLHVTDLVPRFVKLEPPAWTFDPDELEAAVTDRTRGIMVCTPSNPCGKIFTRGELEQVADLAAHHDLFVFTDEIYEYFRYDGREHVPPATLPGMRERTITISGLSKTFGITGWRIGYLHADRRWAKMIGYHNDMAYVCAPAPLQEGVARGLAALPGSYYEDLCDTYERKRDRFCAVLEEVGLTPVVPQGAYYVLADISRLPGATSKERAMHLLETAGVATVPGEAFFHDPEDGLDLTRFCFAKSDADLDEAIRRLREEL